MMVSMAGMFTNLFTGMIVDRVGVVHILIPIMMMATIGMLIQTFAAHIGSFHLLLLGRLVFAFGYDPINVAKGVLINDWFFGAELSTANAINLSFVRGIVFLSGAFTPIIEETSSFTMSFVAGCMLCLLSLGATYFLINFQTKLDN